MLREEFVTELREAIDHVDKARSRLKALHDLAEHDDLPMDVVRRLGAKARVLEITREDLIEIPEMAGRARSGR